MTHEDDVLRERLLRMIGESSSAVTSDQVLDRARWAGAQPIEPTLQKMRPQAGRRALTIGWLVGVVALVAAAIFGIAAANRSPSKVSALHSPGVQGSPTNAGKGSSGKVGHSSPPPPRSTSHLRLRPRQFNQLPVARHWGFSLSPGPT